jgi:hypothetical protein
MSDTITAPMVFGLRGPGGDVTPALTALAAQVHTDADRAEAAAGTVTTGGYVRADEVDAVLPVGKNLFNPHDLDYLANKFINSSNGAPATPSPTPSAYSASGFIPVTPGQSYTMNGMGQMAYYDAGKAFVSGVGQGTPIIGTRTVVVPSSGTVIAYMRVSIPAASLAAFQVEAGAAATAHVAYGRVFDPDALADDTLPGAKLAGGGVTPDKTSFMVASKNLFNPADPDATLGKFVSYQNGATNNNAAYNATGFVPLDENTDYTISYSHQRAFYNAAKGYIGGTNSGNPATFTTPAGTAFGRFTVATSAWSAFQVEAGGTHTDYEPYGFTIDPDYMPASGGGGTAAALGSKFNAHALREYHMRREKRIRVTPEDCRNIIALVGDSYTHNPTRYSGGFAQAEIADQGDGGGGWTGFGFVDGGAGGPYVLNGTQPTLPNGNVRPSQYTMQHVGAWTSSYGIVPAPDACCAVSATAGDRIVLGFPAAASGLYPALTAVDLFWIGTADGVMRYSWNGGSTWTSVNLQGTVGDCSFAALAGFPTNGSAGTLIIEVVSGTCKPAGVNWISGTETVSSSGGAVNITVAGASGAVIHKLGATGRKAQDFATVSANTSWGAALARLGINTLSIMHGTNDQGASRTPEQFEADLVTIASEALVAVPSLDVVITMPAENGRTTNAVKMKQYAASAADAANNNDWGFNDTQREFGDPDNPSVYMSAGARPLYASDGIHPEPKTGGRVLESSYRRFFRYAV